VSAKAATAAVCPALRANGISWLITMVPAVVPRQYATQRAQKVGMRSIMEAWTSAPARVTPRAFDGSQPGGT